ncbi:MAG: FAD-binding oxidoreductase [Nitrososphaerota archaeon]|nr:FAD-binding oxidoreductase [Nitrososphaerota archaeon]
MRRTSGDRELQELSSDSGIISIRPKIAYTAESETDVVSVLQEASSLDISVTPRGGGTSIPSQSVGRGAILLQSGVKAELGPGGVVTCHPSTVKAELNSFLGASRWMPVDPSSYASCTVGGMVANNSSGIRTPKYGSTVDYVRGLRAVIPGGDAKPLAPMPIEDALSGEPRTRRAASLVLENQSDIERERPRVTKNSSGYRLERVVHDGLFDLPKLFVGSEGTLGVLTEVAFSTRERPRWRSLFIAESSLDDLDAVVGAFREHAPAALELVDKSVFRMMGRWDRISRYSRSDCQYMVFCEFDGSSGDGTAKAEEVARSKAGGFDPMVVQGSSEISQAWEARNETLSLAQDIRKGSARLVPGVEDLVVPPDRLGDLVRVLADHFGRRGLDYVSYGHAGDANLHARPFLDLADPGGMAALDGLMEDCFEAVWRMGGSMTAEHGDGMLRAKYVERQYPRTYWIMRELKQLFDPRGILNPGVKIALKAPPSPGASPP